jgi:hypothetical protein
MNGPRDLRLVGPCRWIAVLTTAVTVSAARADPPHRGPEERAIAYLAREVPRWSKEHRCYSCHNNGDAARALYAGVRLGRAVPREALADTSDWLAHPERWDKNGGQGPFSDKRLARVQFVSALAGAIASGALTDHGALEDAAHRLAGDQEPDGSWPIEGDRALGSPATYGRPLVALSARDALHAADAKRYRVAIERADRWIVNQPTVNTPDTSAVLAASATLKTADARAKRRQCLDLLRKGQSDDGGWGPFPDAPPEVFDTAVALLALARLPDPPADAAAMKARARRFLVAQQNDDGSWNETTRPGGGDSYAQRLSTTGWAALALLETATTPGKPQPTTAPDSKRMQSPTPTTTKAQRQ